MTGVIHLASFLILPAIVLPTVPICNLGRSERSGVSVNLLAIFSSEVLDRCRFSIDLGVQIRDLLTGWPESDERVCFVLDGFGVRGGEASQTTREVTDGAVTILLA